MRRPSTQFYTLNLGSTASAGFALAPISQENISVLPLFSGGVAKIAYGGAAQLQRARQNLVNCLPSGLQLFFGKFFSGFEWVNFGHPQNIAGINVANTGNHFLIHQNLVYFTTLATNCFFECHVLEFRVQRVRPKLFKLRQILYLRYGTGNNFGEFPQIGESEHLPVIKIQNQMDIFIIRVGYERPRLNWLRSFAPFHLPLANEYVSGHLLMDK